MCLLAQEGNGLAFPFPTSLTSWLFRRLVGFLAGRVVGRPVQSELTTSSKACGSTTGRLTVSCSVTFTSTVDAVFWWIMWALNVRCWQSCPEGPRATIQVPSHCDLRTLKRNRKIHDEVDFFFRLADHSRPWIQPYVGEGLFEVTFVLTKGDRMWVGQSKLHARLRFDRRIVLSPSSASLPEVFRVCPKF